MVCVEHSNEKKRYILSVGTINLSNSGYYQGIWNNGVAGYIKVQ